LEYLYTWLFLFSSPTKLFLYLKYCLCTVYSVIFHFHRNLLKKYKILPAECTVFVYFWASWFINIFNRGFLQAHCTADCNREKKCVWIFLLSVKMRLNSENGLNIGNLTNTDKHFKWTNLDCLVCGYFVVVITFVFLFFIFPGFFWSKNKKGMMSGNLKPCCDWNGTRLKHWNFYALYFWVPLHKLIHDVILCTYLLTNLLQQKHTLWFTVCYVLCVNLVLLLFYQLT